MRLRAEQVGSLLRPPDLLAARAAHADGVIGLATLRAKEDEAIRAAVLWYARWADRLPNDDPADELL